MGQEILYCFKCQERITSADFDSSNALRFGTRTACKRCVPDLLASLTDKERKDLVSKVQSGPDLRSSTGRYPVSTSTPRPRAVPIPKRAASNQSLLWAVVGGGVVLVLVGLIVALSSGGPPPVREPRDGPPIAPKPTAESPRDRAAREAIERAKNLPSSDFDGQIAAYVAAIQVAEGTSYQREAKERHEGVLDMRRKAYAREIAVVEERARVMVQKEEFGASLAVFDAIRPLHASPEWKAQIDERAEQIRKTADATYAELKEKATSAQAKGSQDELKAIRDRLSRWNLPDMSKDLDAHLASLLPPADARPWTPLFDGKSLDFLWGKGEKAWVVENGSLVRVKGFKASAQTTRQFTDGEFRIRFEGRDVNHGGFAFRQGLGYHFVGWDKVQWQQLGSGEHELTVVLRGDDVTAMLDGKPCTMEKHGTPPLQGPLQFNAYAESFIVRSIEFRDLGLNDGLVGHWTFDSITGTTAPDSSPLKNDGVLIENPVVVPGRLGSALQFDGRRSHVAVPSHPSLVLTGPFTVCAWVKPMGPARRNGAVVEKWDDGPATAAIRGYVLRLTGGRPYLVVSKADEGGEVAATKPVSQDDWSFVAGVFDGSAMFMYVNGALERKVAATQGSHPSTNSLRIGMSGGGGGQHFLGAIDDVRVYSRALSPQEVAKLAQGK